MTNKKKECPVCHKADQVIPIIYGFPDSTLFEKSEKGKIHIGGCIVKMNNPKWFCKRDMKEF